MDLFVGKYDNAIDKKGRVSIPAAFRAALGEPVKSVYIFNSVDPDRDCIVVWSPAEMSRLITKMRRGYKTMSDREKKTARLAIRAGRKIAVDENGRMQLPADMTQKLGVTDTVTFAGEGFYCSIWAPERFDQDMAGLMDGRVEGGDDVLMGLAADEGDEE